jgi:hypothetical protein
MRKAAAAHRGQILSQGPIRAVIGVGEEQIEFAVMQGIQIHLVVLEVMLLDETSWLDAALDLVADGVVGAYRLVGHVPEPERLLWDCDVEALLEVADRV